jgi:hypothetical protein
MMKKIFAILLALALSLSLAACGKTKGAKITLGQSSRFTREELQAAVDCVLAQFRKGYDGCTLRKLWYDEKRAEAQIESYLNNGRGSENGVLRENVLVLLSDFKTDNEPPGGFNPDDTYTGWNWILIRDSKDGAWRVDDYGY